MILKLQQGGNSLPPFVSYTPVTVTGPATAPLPKSNPTSLEDVDLTDKDLLKMLDKLEGLPSDMNSIVSQLQTFYIDKQYNTSASTSTLASRYLSVLQLMKYANFNRKEYDDAYETVSKNGGINEVAINERGQLLCVNKDKDFKLMTVDELKSNKEYSPLTNSELLYYRALDPTLAYNNSLLKIVKNGTSMREITESILKIVDKLGTTKNEEEGYINVNKNEIIRGFESFLNIAKKATNLYNPTVLDLYKSKLITENLAEQAYEALQYIYKSLPENQKTLLKIKSDMTDKGAFTILQHLILSKTNKTKEFFITHNNSKDSDADSNSSDSSKLKETFVSSVLAGRGGHTGTYDINKGLSTGFKVNGTIYEEIKDLKGDHLGYGSISAVLNNSGLRSIIDNSSGIYFGDQKVDINHLNKIEYSDEGFIRTMLPVDLNTGSPDFKILDIWNKAASEIKETNGSPEEIKNILSKSEYKKLLNLFNLDGSLNLDLFKPFILINGVTTDGLLDLELNKFITKLVYDSSIIARMKKTLVDENSEIDLDIDEHSWFNSIFGNTWVNDYDELYKGTIFIPIIMNKNAAALGAAQQLGLPQSLILESEYQLSNKKFHLINPELLK